jgi:hypothetical protein
MHFGGAIPATPWELCSRRFVDWLTQENSMAKTTSAAVGAYDQAEAAVRDTVSEIDDTVQDFIRKRPLTVLGAVFAAGFVYALIRR